MHTFRNSSIFFCSCEVYIRWGIMALREGERRTLVVFGCRGVSDVGGLLSTLVRNLDMVVGIRQSSKLAVAGAQKAFALLTAEEHREK